MVILEVGNIKTTAKNLPPRVKVGLDEALSVYVPGFQFTKSFREKVWDGKDHFFSLQSCKFPTGLLPMAIDTLVAHGCPYEVMDVRIGQVFIPDIPKSINLWDDGGEITLRDYQYNAVVTSLVLGNGIVKVATNGGKTEIAAGIIKILLPHVPKDKKIIFFTHSKEIYAQTKKRLQTRLGIETGDIKDGKVDIQPTVIMAMIPTIQKYCTKPKTLPNNVKLKRLKKACEDTLGTSRHSVAVQEYQEYEEDTWNKINDKLRIYKNLMLNTIAFIGDEVHHSSSDTWYKLFMQLKNAFYRIGLTGTVDETDSLHVFKLKACTGDIISSVSNKYLIDNGYSAKPTIYMLSYINDVDISDYDYTSARECGIINCEARNFTIMMAVLDRVKNGKQCLVIVNEVSHGVILHNSLSHRDFKVKFAHGDRSVKFREEALEGLRNGDIQVLIATSILDEGVDVAGINCIFLAAGGKSMRMLLQRIGRGLRKKSDGSGVEIYDCLDLGNKYLAEHSLDRYQVYKAEGFTVIKQ